MHDIFEGTANYVMVNILDELIYKLKIFSLEFLNSRLEAFPYNQLESNNKIPVINALHILQKKKLKMSSSEMICFCRYFALLVGDKVKDIIANEETEKKKQRVGFVHITQEDCIDCYITTFSDGSCVPIRNINT